MKSKREITNQLAGKMLLLLEADFRQMDLTVTRQFCRGDVLGDPDLKFNRLHVKPIQGRSLTLVVLDSGHIEVQDEDTGDVVIRTNSVLVNDLLREMDSYLRHLNSCSKPSPVSVTHPAASPDQ